MSNSSPTELTEGVTHPNGCFLLVNSRGHIVGDRKVRQDQVDCETWSCECLGEYLHVQRLSPENGEPRRLVIPAASAQDIAMKRARYLAGLMHSANHEAGHATTCYVLRLTHVNFISLEFTVIPTGNLYKQLKSRRATSLKIVKGAASVGEPRDVSLGNLKTLSWACYALGGIAGCNGDGTGAEDDLERCGGLLASIRELDRAAIEPLQKELQSLALEIIQDPIVSPRHSELARRLSESKYLDRSEVEKILLPASLPDYSARLAEIAKKLNVGGTERKRRSFSLSEFPL